MNLQLEINSLSIFLILFSLIILMVTFYLRGKFVAIGETHKKTFFTNTKSVAETKPGALGDFLRANGLLSGVLAVFVPAFIGIGVFEISGENWQDFEYMGPWGITTVVIAFGGMFLSFFALKKLK